MARRSGVHKVGVAAGAFGLLAACALPFVVLRSSRIDSGVDLWVWQALPPWAVVVLAVPWLVVIALSLRDRRDRVFAAARGLAASAAIVVALGLAGFAASHLLPGAGTFARVSVGGSVWVMAFFGYVVVLSARRELEGAPVLAWSISLAAPVLIIVMLVTGWLDDLGVMVEYENQKERFWEQAAVTLLVAASAIVIAAFIGVGLGLLAYLRRRTDRAIFTAVNIFQTVPGLAMIGLLIGPLAALANAVPELRALGIGGLGWAPLIIALTLYALLPIVRNSFEGLRSVSPAAKDAGRGMGMSRAQLMRRIELPIARPVIFSGIRTSSVQAVGNSILGAFLGGIGLGFFVLQGMSAQSTDLILLGSISIVIMALVVDGVMRLVEHVLTPKGLRSKEANRP
ncbi:MAG: ABC transporter permease [Coriobacteriales bacterium]|nr:ABC transporter permease [Coriobacteriales bacterium]